MTTKESRKVVLEEATLEHLLRELEESQRLLRQNNRRLAGMSFIFMIATMITVFSAIISK